MNPQSPELQRLREAAIKEFVLGSDSMDSVMDIVSQVAQYDVNVLITGESGTGKELLAKIIHLQSDRAKNAFVPVNCGILSGLIFEDKLFGHEKGAFTGAIHQKKGCFELADHGTLFLDEVSELPYENQVDFLRVLEDFRFSRIGGTRIIDVNVRIVSATNKDLNKLIEEGGFREDLYYRLKVVPIHLPPLRQRREAIPRLVNHILNQLSENYRKPKPHVTEEVLKIFNRYNWPGNIRELKNLLERVFIVNDTGKIDMASLPSDFLWHFNEPSSVLSLAQVRKKAETQVISEVLNRTRGNREKAAELLDISPRTLRHKIALYNLDLSRGSFQRDTKRRDTSSFETSNHK